MLSYVCAGGGLQVARVGAEVEAALGSAQDIEGAVEMTADGARITLVQTRPQM